MNCPNCTAPLPMDRVDRTSLFVRCDWCSTSVRLNSLDPPSAVDTTLKPRIGRPTDLVINRVGDSLVIQQSTLKAGNIGGAAFIAVWLVILVVMATTVLRFAPGGLFALFFIAMGTFGLIAFVKSIGPSVQALNITISPTMISVQQSGMFPGRTIREPRAGIRQLWVEEDFIAGSYSRERRNEPVAQYSLNVLRGDHTKRRIATFPDRESAQYLEQEIEKFLNIADQPVKGEYAG